MSDWTGNRNSIFKTIGASNHTDKEREVNDYYATDPIAIDKLFAVEIFSRYIYECACGEGHLSERMKKYGKIVVSTDIVDRGYKEQVATLDFLNAPSCVGEYYDIITNPPYKYAREFVERAMECLADGGKCAMLLKLTFLEGQRRRKLFEAYPPKTVYVFSERLLCAKNGDFEKMRANGGSAIAYAWFVWEKGWEGETKIKWI